jgi:hypothetical protein
MLENLFLELKFSGKKLKNVHSKKQSANFMTSKSKILFKFIIYQSIFKKDKIKVDVYAKNGSKRSGVRISVRPMNYV